ncbi:hypothetical protein BM613_08865 [Sulfoacidibacillus thermotolerans]|uniref:Uncharacterized protein n=2 Tax=Sulfoacidibacillus thermotolerans TaxID=1765684 RepID=A0A2U3D7Z9_SULT2|nr:hypothetical protein BM613_08865 [Sulfoacidibacillus thermotolerans]
MNFQEGNNAYGFRQQRGGRERKACRNMNREHVARLYSDVRPPAVQGLFEDWLANVQGELLSLLKAQQGKVDLAQIAVHLSISKQSARELIARLYEQEQIEIVQVTWKADSSQ